MPNLYYSSSGNNIILPTPARRGDVGIDITAISEYKRIGKKTIMYETGISVHTDDEYYIEIVPRSSIVKTGYILSNSIGVIDQGYTSTLKIVLTKVDDSLPDIEVPFTLCQLVLRPYLKIVPQTIDIHRETQRGVGGFGSTD
jgi:dUTP pyrophosphatase